MSGSVNKVIIVGNLGADPDVRHTQSGDKIVNLSVATSDKWKTRDGEPKERTEWHRVVVFGKLADIAAQYLRKGSKAYFEGQLQTRKWQDKDGKDRYTTEVVLSGFNAELTLLDSKPRDDREAGAEGGPDFDDEIPF